MLYLLIIVIGVILLIILLSRYKAKKEFESKELLEELHVEEELPEDKEETFINDLEVSCDPQITEEIVADSDVPVISNQEEVFLEELHIEDELSKDKEETYINDQEVSSDLQKTEEIVADSDVPVISNKEETLEELHIEDELSEDKVETFIDDLEVSSDSQKIKEIAADYCVPVISNEEEETPADEFSQIIAEIANIADLMDTNTETAEDDKVVTTDEIEEIELKARFYEKLLQYRRACRCYYKLFQFYEMVGNQKEADIIRNKLESLLRILKIRNQEISIIHTLYKSESGSVAEGTSYAKDSHTIISGDLPVIPYDKAFAKEKKTKLNEQNIKNKESTQTNKSNQNKDIKVEIRELVYKAKRKYDIEIFEKAAEMALNAGYPKGWQYSYYNICNNYLMDLYRKQGDILKEYHFIDRALKILRLYMKPGIAVFESRFRELTRIISSGMPQEHKTEPELQEFYNYAVQYERESNFKKALEQYSMIACAYLDARDARYLEIIDKKCDIYRLLGYKFYEFSEIDRALSWAEEFKHSLIENYRIHFKKRKETI